MQNYNTLPMPEGFGQQVETPHGWRFRHCATFFFGDRCPDCGKEGFIAAANEINQVETYEIGVDAAVEGADKTGLTGTPPAPASGAEKKDEDTPAPPTNTEGAEQGTEIGTDQTPDEKTPEDFGDAMISAAIASDKLQSTPPAVDAPAPASTPTQGGKQTRKQKI